METAEADGAPDAVTVTLKRIDELPAEHIESSRAHARAFAKLIHAALPRLLPLGVSTHDHSDICLSWGCEIPGAISGREGRARFREGYNHFLVIGAGAYHQYSDLDAMVKRAVQGFADGGLYHVLAQLYGARDRVRDAQSISPPEFIAAQEYAGRLFREQPDLPIPDVTLNPDRGSFRFVWEGAPRLSALASGTGIEHARNGEPVNAERFAELLRKRI